MHENAHRRINSIRSVVPGIVLWQHQAGISHSFLTSLPSCCPCNEAKPRAWQTEQRARKETRHKVLLSWDTAKGQAGSWGIHYSGAICPVHTILLGHCFCILRHWWDFLLSMTNKQGDSPSFSSGSKRRLLVIFIKQASNDTNLPKLSFPWSIAQLEKRFCLFLRFTDNHFTQEMGPIWNRPFKVQVCSWAVGQPFLSPWLEFPVGEADGAHSFLVTKGHLVRKQSLTFASYI